MLKYTLQNQQRLNHPQKEGHVTLAKGIPRPKWQLKNQDIEVVERKNNMISWSIKTVIHQENGKIVCVCEKGFTL